MKGKSLYSIPMSVIIERYIRKTLQVPAFQREFVWNKKRIQLWAKTLRGHGIAPAFTFYRFDANETAHRICDGLQRLIATLEIREHPQKHGFSNRDEVDHVLFNCQVPVHDVIFDTEREAIDWYIRINGTGVALTPKELFKGDLVNSTCSHGEFVYNHAARWLQPAMEIVCRDRGASRDDKRTVDSKTHRGALALFYQFISGYQGYTFWNYSNAEGKSSKTVEFLLAEHIARFSKKELTAEISRYMKFVDFWSTILRTEADRINPEAEMSPGMFRYMLNVAIYAKHNGNKDAHVVDVIRHTFRLCPDLTLKAVGKTPDGENFSLGLNSSSLRPLFTAFKRAGIVVDIKVPNRQ